MENRFSNAQVYEIICKLTGRRYIGSTTQQYLSSRLSGHSNCFTKYKKGQYPFYTVFNVLESGQYYINLLEKCTDVNNINDLRKRERFYIESMPCENKNIPGRGKHEWNNQKNVCVCGGRYTQVHKNVHMGTNKHALYDFITTVVTETTETTTTTSEDATCEAQADLENLANEVLSETPGPMLCQVNG